MATRMVAYSALLGNGRPSLDVRECQGAHDLRLQQWHSDRMLESRD